MNNRFVQKEEKLLKLADIGFKPMNRCKIDYVESRYVRRFMQDASALRYRLFTSRNFAMSVNSTIRYSQGNHRTDSPVLYSEPAFAPDGRSKDFRGSSEQRSLML